MRASGAHHVPYHSVSLLQDRFSDYASWIERLQAKLEAKGLWETFCVKNDMPPDESRYKVAYDSHMEKLHDCRWKTVMELFHVSNCAR